MADSYRIQINTTTETRNDLEGWELVMFRGVSAGHKAVPTVWSRVPMSKTWSDTTTISWTDQYVAYVSTNPILEDNVSVHGTSECAVDLGDIAEVNSSNSIKKTTLVGEKTEVAIINNSGKLVCGLKSIPATAGSGTSPKPNMFCAVPLLSGAEDFLTPMPIAALIWLQKPRVVDAVTLKAIGTVLVLDIKDKDRAVSYSSSDKNPWSDYSPKVDKIVLRGQDQEFVDALIKEDPSLLRRRIESVDSTG